MKRTMVPCTYVHLRTPHIIQCTRIWMYITRNHSAKVQLADSLKTIHDHIATLLSNIDIMSNSAATRTGEDDNLVLTILARVPYEGRPYHQFRGVNRRFNRLMGDGGRHATALPTMVARRQFTPFYQLGNAIGPRGGYEWEGFMLYGQESRFMIAGSISLDLWIARTPKPTSQPWRS